MNQLCFYPLALTGVHVVGRAGSREPSVLGFVDARSAAGVFSVLRQKTL